MNFDDTPQEAAFRAEAKAWISANAPKQYEEELRKSSLGRTQLKGANILEVAKAWQKKKAEAGWACLHWPKEYGGRGASPIERVIRQQEGGAFGKLSATFIIGHGKCGPTTMSSAGEEQKCRDQADQAGQRPIGIQRSVFYRGENPGCAAARRRQ